jgi:transposase
MQQEEFSGITSSTKFDSLSKADLIGKVELLERELTFAVKEIYRLKNQVLSDHQIELFLKEQLSHLQSDLFGASSERYKKPEPKIKEEKPPTPRVRKPSERYPNLPIKEILIEGSLPTCDHCETPMKDSGLREVSEQLTVIPKKYEILQISRVKYRCQCNSCIKTAPLPPRIIEGSSFSDEMIIDVAASKYCDLIPVERYSAIVKRECLMDLPPQSLIELTHGFADYVSGAYDLIKNEVLSSRVLHADETPHKMLEGSPSKNWYLWGFSNERACFLSIQNTRSGDVAHGLLKDSQCEVLISDVYSGYSKAIRLANKERAESGQNLIKSAFCNAHSRRYFFKVRDHYKGSHYYLDQYHEIYELNKKARGRPPNEVLELRAQMKPLFQAMKDRAIKELGEYPRANKYNKALSYFVSHFEGLTLFLEDPEVAIDNNAQERLLRSHVVGRKTWYGTHSKLGAKTAAILFTLVETCKLIKVNPRAYFRALTEALHQGKAPLAPWDFIDQTEPKDQGLGSGKSH